jgi:hypothetical protein
LGGLDGTIRVDRRESLFVTGEVEVEGAPEQLIELEMLDVRF